MRARLGLGLGSVLCTEHEGKLPAPVVPEGVVDEDSGEGCRAGGRAAGARDQRVGGDFISMRLV